MTTYYVSFTIADDAAYSDRYNALISLLQGYDHTIWWAETTSYMLFQSDKSASQIAADIKGVIDTSKDIALVAAPHYKTMLVVGSSTDNDIYKLVDFAKKV